MLVQSLLDLDVRNSSGRTPLDLAAFKGHVECVDVLINQGASILVKDYILKRTPIHAAGVSDTVNDFIYCFLSNTLFRVLVSCTTGSCFNIFLAMPAACGSSGTTDCTSATAVTRVTAVSTQDP